MTIDARVAHLEATVDDLRRDLEHLRKQRRLPMRQTHRCSACGGARVLNITLIADMKGDVGSVPLSLAKDLSFWGTVKDHLGPLEAFVCRSCLLVEWHAGSLDGLEPDGKTVIELEAPADADPEAGPYR